jgi:hypothetical protein
MEIAGLEPVWDYEELVALRNASPSAFHFGQCCPYGQFSGSLQVD